MEKDKDKGTVYQKLNGIFNFDGFGTTTGVEQEIKNNKVIIKGNSPEEVHRKGLELEQKRSLINKFTKTTDRNYQKALQYESARLPAYMDYEGMEYYPIISSALDLFMEEATTIGLDGKMLNIYSNKDRIKYLLEDFYYNILNVNTNLPFWTRNTPVKYNTMVPLLNGETITIKEISDRLKDNPSNDIWTYAVQDETKNIVTGKIVWCDLTRKDSEILKIHLDDGNFVETTVDHEFMLRNGKYKRADELLSGDSLMPFYTLVTNESNVHIKGYEKVYNPSTNHYKFTHRIISHECVRNLDIEQISNDKYITHHKNFNKLDNYPTNLLRMTTSDHISYHNNISEKILKRPDVVEKRMQGINKYLRSKKRRDKMSEDMSGIYPQCFNDYNNSSLHDAHNITRKRGMLKLWSDTNFKNNVKDRMTLKIDNECLAYIINFLKGSNYISAKNLGEKLKNDNAFMELFKATNNHFRKDLYKSLSSTTVYKLINRATNLSYYDFVYSIKPDVINESNFKRANSISSFSKHKAEVIINHKVLSVERLIETQDVYCMEVVGPNNEQDRHNFPICGRNENGEYQRNGVFVSNCKYGDNFVLMLGERKKGITAIKQMVNFEIERTERIVNGKSSILFKERMTGDEFNAFEIAHFRLLGDDKYIPYGSSLLNKVRRVFRQLIMAEDAMLTYRIIRAGEKKVFKIDVGNIDDDDIEEYMYKVATKFKKVQQVSPNDGQIDYRFNILGNDEDYFLPVRNANTQTGIETLPGATNLNDIHDIEYLRDNLFMGLGIPKPFLSFQDASGGGKNVSQFDIRFAKKVNRIQQAMVQELTKMGMIHLYLLGYSTEDFNDFTLTLTNPSTQLDIQKSELLREKSQTYTELTRSEGGIAAMSHTGAKRMLFNMTDREIVEDLKQQKMEKVIMQEFADAPVTIKKSGLFADIDKRYGDPTAMTAVASGNTGQGGAPAVGAPAGGGMPPIGMNDMGGGEGSMSPPAEGLPNQSPSELPPIEAESVGRRKLMSETEFDERVEKLVYGHKLKSESNPQVIYENELNASNKNAINMINEIDELINGDLNDVSEFTKNIELPDGKY